MYVQSGQASLRVGVRADAAGPGDYVVFPVRPPTAGRPRRAKRLKRLVVEAAGHVLSPRPLPDGATASSGGGPVFRTRPPARRRTRSWSIGDGPVPVLVRSRQGWSRHCHAHHPFDVVGWDGCALPVRPFHPRLRADRRPYPPTAPGPPDLRRPRLRDLQLRASAFDFDPAVHQGPVSPRQCRLGRGAVLLRMATS